MASRNKEVQDIKDCVNNFKSSELMKKMIEGDVYYKQQNSKIANIKKQYYSTTNKSICEDPYKANHKLYSGFVKLLVKQKVGYSINKSISLKGENTEVITEFIPKYINLLKKMATESSIKSYSVLQFYIDDNDKKLKYKTIPSEQIIIINNQDNKDMIDKVIRFYSKNKKVIVEVYDNENVSKYTFNESWRFESQETLPILVDSVIYGEGVQETKPNTWGKPPFAVLYNNYEKQTDLEPIKSFIDIYDITTSDFANNIDDFQDVYLTLKNFHGENDEIDQVLRDIKQHKVIVTAGDNTGADFNTVEIPVVARESMTKIAENNIYKFGMGLNMDGMDGNITNVRIKAMYTNLNLKANDFEEELEAFWQEVIYFINKYLEFNKRELVTSELVFVRDKIVNEAEMLEANAKQIGNISEDTRLQNHIWVTDVEKEKAMIKKETDPIKITDTKIIELIKG